MAISAIEELELNTKIAKANVSKGKVLQRLLKNQDFQEIIGKGYLEQEAIRLVHLKAAFDKQDSEHQIAITKAIDAIGILKNYLDTIFVLHDQAIKELEMNSTTYEEILREDIQ